MPVKTYSHALAGRINTYLLTRHKYQMHSSTVVASPSGIDISYITEVTLCQDCTETAD